MRSLGLRGALNLRGAPRPARPIDDAEELSAVFPRGFLAEEREEEIGQMCGKFFVFEDDMSYRRELSGGGLRTAHFPSE